MSARWDLWKAGLLGWARFGVFLGALGGGCLTCSAQAPPPACEGGFRRTGSLHDFTLGRGWTIYADCAHPERPMVAVASEAGRPMALAGSAAGAVRQESGRTGTDTGTEAAAVAQPAIAKDIQQIGTPSETGVFRAKPASAATAAPPTVESGSRVRIWRRDGVAAIDLAGIALESGAAGARIRVRVSPGGAVLRGAVRAAGSVELEAPGSGGFAGEGK